MTKKIEGMAKAHHTRLIAALLAVSLAAILLALVESRPAEAAFPGTNGKIAFYREGDVWTMNQGGTGAARLTTDYNAEANPSVSPDGSRIAYEFLRGIWVMNVDGSAKRQLTDGATTDEDPAFSADGTKIAFMRDRDIFSMNADGSGLRNLTRTPGDDDLDPAFSPDGDRIAYTHDGSIYVMDADGTNRTNLTPEDSLPQCPNQPGYYHDGASRAPAWSPDGTKIAFSGALICPHTIGKDIWVMNATDGSEKTNLIDDEDTTDVKPVFSPDGTKILFESNRDSDKTEFYTMSPTDGSGMTRLTTNATWETDADWQPIPGCTRSGAGTFAGTPGDDVICGSPGDDRINGLGGDDLILGGGGDDTLLGAEGRDTLNGGPGIDTASFAGSATPVNASLVSGFARRVGTNPLEGVALVGIENLSGSAGSDTLTGSGIANALVGGSGADKMFGLAGNDTLNSRDGVNRNDSLDGGGGTDRCVTDATEASVRGCE
jgi:Tol biopolymer transport system component